MPYPWTQRECADCGRPLEVDGSNVASYDDGGICTECGASCPKCGGLLIHEQQYLGGHGICTYMVCPNTECEYQYRINPRVYDAADTKS